MIKGLETRREDPGRNLGALGAALLTFLLAVAAQPAHGAAPRTIPALREWTDTSGSYVFGETTQIILEEADAAQLSDAASTLAQDLLDLTGYSIPVVIGISNAQTGDIYLTLGATDPALGQEGYLLEVSDQFRIRAPTETGVFYGTRSLLQMLRQGYEIPGGTARDWPDYPERGLMVDLGRKYFSMPFLRRHIKELAYLKLNYFHLHLSDTFGFRLESARHPEITSPQHYSKADIQALLALAASYHVMLVPEIDLPAHATALLAAHPELQLPGHPDKLDLGQPASYTLVEDLLEEYLPLFPAPFWHTGADEYLAQSEYDNYPQLLSYAQQQYGPSASAQDVYLGFVNWVDGLVKSQGKQLRAWNDIYGTVGAVNAPEPDIILEEWTTSILPADALLKGHSILNCNYASLYYVLGWPDSQQANPVNLYLYWAPNLQWPGNVSLPAGTPGMRGGKLHVWCDLPDAQTEDQVQTGIADSLRGLAQNSWGSPKLVAAYSAFAQISDQTGHEPGWGPDFTLTPPAQSASVAAGQSATYTLQLTPLLGFHQPIGLSCATQLTGAACTVAPATVTLDGSNAVSVIATVSTTGAGGVALNPIQPPAPRVPSECAWAALILPGLFWRARRGSRGKARGRLRLAVAALLLGGLAAASCGSSRSAQPIPPQTPAGNYTVVLTASSGSLTHRAVLELTVR